METTDNEDNDYEVSLLLGRGGGRFAAILVSLSRVISFFFFFGISFGFFPPDISEVPVYKDEHESLSRVRCGTMMHMVDEASGRKAAYRFYLKS